MLTRERARIYTRKPRTPAALPKAIAVISRVSTLFTYTMQTARNNSNNTHFQRAAAAGDDDDKIVLCAKKFKTRATLPRASNKNTRTREKPQREGEREREREKMRGKGRETDSERTERMKAPRQKLRARARLIYGVYISLRESRAFIIRKGKRVAPLEFAQALSLSRTYIRIRAGF